jgi:glycine betaine/proline transport system substrate-binding protein
VHTRRRTLRRTLALGSAVALTATLASCATDEPEEAAAGATGEDET